jgi:hypothetical protein
MLFLKPFLGPSRTIFHTFFAALKKYIDLCMVYIKKLLIKVRLPLDEDAP